MYLAETTYQYEVFLGNLATAQPLGIVQRRTQERDEPAEAFSAPTDRWVTSDGVTVTTGAVVYREVVEHTPGQEPTVGAWKFWGYIWEPRVQLLRAVALNRQVAAAAGQPMRNPLGLPVILQSDGTRPLQPASGEPARHPYTGELTGELEP